MDSWILEITETQAPDSWVGAEGWEPRYLNLKEEGLGA